jgi:hypothetical protein
MVSWISDEDADNLRRMNEMWEEQCKRAGLDPRVEGHNRQVELQARLERIRAELVEEFGEADDRLVYRRLLDELEAEREAKLGIRHSDVEH